MMELLSGNARPTSHGLVKHTFMSQSQDNSWDNISEECMEKTLEICIESAKLFDESGRQPTVMLRSCDEYSSYEQVASNIQ